MEEERSSCRKNLKERDTTEVLTALGLDKKTIAMQKMRDIFKNASIKYTGKSYVVLIGVENQSDIHYAIPIKNMFYDVMAYGNQVKETAKKHRKDKDTTTSDEFLSGFTKEDKLIPVITITVYISEQRNGMVQGSCQICLVMWTRSFGHSYRITGLICWHRGR